jgi:hypothetical protein
MLIELDQREEQPRKRAKKLSRVLNRQKFNMTGALRAAKPSLGPEGCGPDADF